MNYFWRVNRYGIVFFLVGSLLVAGCAAPPIPAVHKSIDLNLVNQTFPTRVQSRIINEEISIRVNRERMDYSGGNVGLLTVLIAELVVKAANKSKTGKVEKMIAPLLEATADINFRTQYWNELEKALSASPWLKTEHLDKSSAPPTQKELDEIKPPILVLNTFYQLSPNAQVLIVQTRADLYLKDNKQADYFGSYTYFSNPAGKNEEVEDEAISLWTAAKASVYREALTEGIKQNMEMLRLDLLDRPANPDREKGETARLRIRNPFSGILDIWEGKVQNRNENRLIIRELGGNLFSIGSGQIE